MNKMKKQVRTSWKSIVMALNKRFSTKWLFCLFVFCFCFFVVFFFIVVVFLIIFFSRY